MCRFGLRESLKTVAITVIYEINPYFLFFHETQMGGKGEGKPQMGGHGPLASPLGAAPAKE